LDPIKIVDAYDTAWHLLWRIERAFTQGRVACEVRYASKCYAAHPRLTGKESQTCADFMPASTLGLQPVPSGAHLP